MSDLRLPQGLKYTKEHEWIKVEGNVGLVGITDFAQDQLGDVVFVELPATGRELKKGEQFGVVESVKTVSDLYSPATGTVLEVNTELEGAPELINQQAYTGGWILKVQLANPAELESLLSAEEYAEFIKEAGH